MKNQQTFKLYFDAHKPDLLVCEVEIEDELGHKTLRWYEEVHLDVPCNTLYFGPESTQPRFVITGAYDHLRLDGNKLYIH